MEEIELKKRIKNGDISGCFILTGEEDYLVNYYEGLIKKTAITDPAFATFNYFCGDGPDMDFGAILDAIKSPPMFEERKVVEWKYPVLRKNRSSFFDDLEKCIKLLDEYKGVTLLFVVALDDIDIGTKYKKTEFEKRFSNICNICNFEKADDRQLYNWLKRHFEAESIDCSFDAIKRLVEISGHSMMQLNFECKKLSEYLKANGRVELTVADVELIASRTSESDTFALSNAIIEKNKQNAYLAMLDLKNKRVEPVIIMAMIGKIFNELLKISFLLDDGIPQNEIGGILKMSNYKLQLNIKGAKNYGTKKLAKIVKEHTRVDSSSKQGGISSYTAVEMFLGNCL